MPRVVSTLCGEKAQENVQVGYVNMLHCFAKTNKGCMERSTVTCRNCGDLCDKAHRWQLCFNLGSTAQLRMPVPLVQPHTIDSMLSMFVCVLRVYPFQGAPLSQACTLLFSCHAQDCGCRHGAPERSAAECISTPPDGSC